MKVHVLGGGGVVGFGIRAALAADHEVASFGRESYDDARARYSSEVLPRCDCLVHAAGVTDEEVAMDEGAAIQRAIGASTELFEAAARAGCSRLVYVSSLHVYGSLIDARGGIDERAYPAPRNVYAWCHLATEWALRQVAAKHQLLGLVVRPGAVFGFPEPSRRVNRVQLAPYEFPNQLITSHRIVLKTAGRQHRSFSSNLHIGRLVRDWLASATGGCRVDVVNDHGEVTLSVREFADACATIYERVAGIPASVVAPDSPAAGAPGPVKPPAVPASLDEFLSTYITSRTAELAGAVR